MRDIVIAGLVLTGGGYAALTYAPTTSEAEIVSGHSAQATVAVVEAAADIPASVPVPAANPWRGVPLPPHRPARNVTVLEDVAPEPKANVSVLHAGLIEIDGIRYALKGIDAPAASQTCRTPRTGMWACGTDARRAVQAFVSHRDVTCSPAGAATQDVVVARCDADGVDLAEWVVTSGWAVADVGVTEAYVTAERTAEADARGLWAGWFETPSVWRSENGDLAPTRMAATDAQDQVDVEAR